MNLFKKDGSNVEVMIKSEHVTKYKTMDNYTIEDFEIPEFGTYLLVVVNAYAVGGLAIITNGEFSPTVYVFNINLDKSYYNITSKNNHSITVQIGNASSAFYLVKLY